MTKQTINVGTSANDRKGDSLRTAFQKVNANFTELYSSSGFTGTTDRLVNNTSEVVLSSSGILTLPYSNYLETIDINLQIGSQGVVTIRSDAASNLTTKSWRFDTDGVLTFPNGETLLSQPSQLYFHKDDNDYVGEIVLQAEGVGIQATHPTLGNSLINISTNSATISINNNEWEFDRSGTLTTPLLLPKTFTAVLDSAHKTGAPLTLTDTPWEFTVQFQVNPNGTVETMMNSIFPNLVNPGYTTADQFSFTEADHGIPGYTFELELDNLVLAGPAGWTASPVVSIPPEYPATVKSLGSIKLVSDEATWVFGTDGTLTVPGPIFRDGGLYMNSSGSTTAASVFVSGNSGGVILRTADNAQQISHDLIFDVTGGLTLPSAGFVRQNHSFTRTTIESAPAATATVIWSASQDWISSIKLTIQVEGNVTGDATGWHVQTCEATIASRGYADGTYGYGDPEMTVYGVIHTSVSPLATFEVQRNPTTRLVEVVATGTDISNNITVSIHSVEIGTTD